MGKILYPNYFANCIATGTPEHSEDYLAFNLREAMSMFWKVKSWNAIITGSLSYTIGGGGGTETISFLGESHNFPSPVGTEEELSCYVGGFNYEYVALAQRSNNFFTDIISTGNFFSYNFHSALQSGGRYYIPVRIGNTQFWFSEYAAPEPNASYIPVGGYTISFAGGGASGDVYENSDPASGGYPDLQGSVSINISASSYWPYA